ncbi:MAG: HAD family hydrolase, partial [Planctomycetota bacterium]|nr:HAD family hydrolase [Planctomycetota bacterium]
DSVFYQKHMTHHLLPGISRDWLCEVEHLFLIREPREMLTSLMKQIPQPTLEDTGLPQQVELLCELKAIGKTPLVLESKDVLKNPKGMLTLTCEKLGIGFDDAMLSWPAGPRESDGVWAPHWYASVEASTGFAPWKPKEEEVPAHLEDVCLECEALYSELLEEKLERHDATEV